MSVENYQMKIAPYNPISRQHIIMPSYQASQALPVPQVSQPTKLTLPPIRELLRDNVNNETASVKQNIQQLQPSPQQLTTFTPSPSISRSSSYQSLYSHQPLQLLQQAQPSRISPTVISNLGNSYISYPLQTPPQQHSQNLPSPPSNVPSSVIVAESREKLTRRKRQNLPRQTTLILLNWLSEHLDRPYPNSREKYELLVQTKLTIQQLDNWFINARRRKTNILKKLKENDQSIALSF